MEELNKKAGYLNGLLAGINAEKDPVTAAIADLLTTLTDRVSAHEILLADLNDYVESIDDDLSALENGTLPEADDGYDDDLPDDRKTLRVVNGGVKPQAAEPAPAGCVCPDCRGLFLIASTDPPGQRYECPACRHIVIPEPLSAANAVLIDPVKS